MKIPSHAGMTCLLVLGGMPLANASNAGGIGFVRITYPRPIVAATRQATARAEQIRRAKLRRWREQGKKGRAAEMRRRAETRRMYEWLLARGKKLSEGRSSGRRPVVGEASKGKGGKWKPPSNNMDLLSIMEEQSQRSRSRKLHRKRSLHRDQEEEE